MSRRGGRTRLSTLLVALLAVAVMLVAPLAASAAAASVVSGRVTGPDGTTPLPGMQVKLWMKMLGSWDFTTYGQTAITGSDGRYTFSALSINTDYAVQFVDPAGGYVPEFYNHKATVLTADVIRFAAVGTRADVDASLIGASSVRGTIRDSSGAVVGGVHVNAYHSLGGGAFDTTVTASALSAADGTYVIGGLPAGSYGLQYWDTGNRFATHFRLVGEFGGATDKANTSPVTVATGQALTGIDETMLKWGNLAGTVSSGGVPLVNVIIDPFRAEGGVWSQQATAMTQSIAGGTYATSQLYPGRYRVRFNASGFPVQFHAGSASIDGGTDVTVLEGVTTNLDAVLLAADTPPVAPSNLLLVAGAPAPAVALTWTDNATNETGFVIERSRNSGGFAAVYSPAAGATFWTDPLTGFTASEKWGSTWAYRIKAAGVGGDSAYATSAGLKLDTTPPTTIANVNANYVGSASITIVGSDAQSGVAWTEYQIDASAITSGPVATTSVLGAHSIKHRAMDNAGNLSAWSSPAQGFTVVAATYTLTYLPGTGGTIVGTSPQTVSHGGSGTAVSALAKPGYRFTGWSDSVMTASRTDANVTAGVSVTANFAVDVPNTYALTYTPGTNGTITGTSPQSVTSGGSGTRVTAVPSIGYHFVNWSDSSTANPRTDTNVTADKSVTAKFAADSTAPNLLPVYRFYNLKAGVHFYTASEAEMLNVRATLSGVYRFEGAAYSINLANPNNTLPVYRFYNIKAGVHFYTASEAEKNTVLSTLWRAYRLEGTSYYVSTTSVNAFPVYRFYNIRQGVHFYTASESEMASVRKTLSGVYRFEGVGYYVGK